MDRFIPTVAYAATFGVLFVVVLTPLMQGLASLGLNDPAPALIAWFIVLLVPFVPARLLSDL